MLNFKICDVYGAFYKQLNITERYEKYMNFSDIIKKSVLEEFSGGLTSEKILLSLGISLLLSLFVILVYRIAFRGVAFSSSYTLSLLLLSMITTVMIMTITSNIVLSLGMVGALSIVRFRTAVKDPVDTVFMYWAICVGIVTGAGLYFVSALANLAIGLIYLVVCFIWKKTASSPYLLTVRFRPEVSDGVKHEIKTLRGAKIKSKAITKAFAEYTVEFRSSGRETDIADSFRSVEGVLEVAVVSIAQ